VDENGKANFPNPTQQRVLDWVDKVRVKPTSDHIPVLYLQGGVGCGKSRGIMAPIMEMLLEVPEIRILWARQDFNDIKLSIMDKFFEIMPPELILKKNEQYHWYDISQGGGNKGRAFFNGLKDITGLGSQEFGVVAVTEAHESNYIAYQAIKRRCRQEKVPNMILLESEAPNEDNWLAKVTDPRHEWYDPHIEKWEISTYENWENLPLSYRGSLETMPESWKKKYLYGKTGFMPDGTPFYRGFKDHIHAGEFEAVTTRPLYVGWDFGFHHPAVVISQIDMQDRWIILREHMGTDITIHNFADKIKELLHMEYPNMEYIHYGDPAVVQVNDKSELTSWQILKAKGIEIAFRASTYRDRKEIIEHKLGTLVGGKPMLMVDKRRCKTIVDGFLGGYHYPERRDKQSFGIKFEQPFRDGFYEHLMNSLEYIAVNRFAPTKPTNTARRRIVRRRPIESRDNI